MPDDVKLSENTMERILDIEKENGLYFMSLGLTNTEESFNIVWDSQNGRDVSVSRRDQEQ